MPEVGIEPTHLAVLDFESSPFIAKFLILLLFSNHTHAMCMKCGRNLPFQHATDGTCAQTPEVERPRQRPNGLAKRENALVVR